MRLIKGISPAKVEGIERARRDGSFTSMADLARRSGAASATLARLAAADAMRSMGLSRREAVWNVLTLGDNPPMFAGYEPREDRPHLPAMSKMEVVFADYETIGLSLNAHPLELVRPELKRISVTQAKALRHTRVGTRVKVAGLVVVRQRPATAAGITFCTLEDETGTSNLIIKPNVWDRYRHIARRSIVQIAEGRVERQDEVVHVQVSRISSLSQVFADLNARSRDFR